MKYEQYIRLISFIGIFIIISVWELIAPRLKIKIPKIKRWYNNLSIIVLNTVIVRIIIPAAPMIIAFRMEEAGIGLIGSLEISYAVKVIASILIFDLIIYFQHLMFHAVPLLWRLHMVHHADLGIDLTTGLRFHLIEIIISLFIKMGTVLLLGLPALAVLIFEVILNAAAVFNHGNIYINPKIDKILRLFIITPDMHRVHHSVAINETNSNFGFNLSWWDYIFGTYRKEPKAGNKNIVIGLSQYRSHLGLGSLLLLPFNGDQGYYAINRRFKDLKNK